MVEDRNSVPQVPASLQEPFRSAMAMSARTSARRSCSDEADARRAVRDAEVVAQLCERLLSESI
jgi:hypothetical protein